MLKRLAVILVALVALTTATIAAVWTLYFQPIVLQETLKTEGASLALALWVLEQGGRPEDWENRAYLPTATVQKLADALLSVEYVSRQGKRDEQGAYDGSFVIRLDAVSLTTQAGQLEPKLTVTARYQPDRVDHWWGGATVKLDLAALFMPEVRVDPETQTRSVALQIVPTRIEPSLSWQPVRAVLVGKMISEMASAGVFVGLGEKLSLAAPMIREPLKLEVQTDNTTNAKFEGDRGSYDLRTRLAGPTLERTIEANVPLFTANGLWLLGHPGRSLPAPPDGFDVGDNLKKRVEDLKRDVAQMIGPFDRNDDIVEIRLSNRPLMEIAKEIQTPAVAAQLVMSISSANANGVIKDTYLFKDKLLGDLGLIVRPRVADFVTGSVRFQSPTLSWVTGEGLKADISASANVTASTNIHLSTAFVGGGIGKNVDLFGETRASLPVSLRLEHRKTAAGEAIVLQPLLGCSAIEMDVNPATREDIIKELWVALKPVGVRIKRKIGGGRHAPSILLDNLPAIRQIGVVEGEETNKPGAAPDYLRAKHIQMAWTIAGLDVQGDGLLMRAGLEVQPVEANPWRASEPDKMALKDALLAAAPDIPCEADDSYALLLVGNGVEVGPDNEIINLTTKPIETIAKFPENAIREAGKGLENLGKAGEKVVQDAGKAGENLIQEAGKTIERLVPKF